MSHLSILREECRRLISHAVLAVTEEDDCSSVVMEGSYCLSLLVLIVLLRTCSQIKSANEPSPEIDPEDSAASQYNEDTIS
jgi:hypothetical protein